jgi:hypothetical protein
MFILEQTAHMDAFLNLLFLPTTKTLLSQNKNKIAILNHLQG